jgi:hypothetical protein
MALKPETSRFMIAGVPVMVKMGFRLALAYLRYKRKAKKAAAIFERELLAGGVGREQAQELTELYLRSSRLLHLGIGAAKSGSAAPKNSPWAKAIRKVRQGD